MHFYASLSSLFPETCWIHPRVSMNPESQNPCYIKHFFCRNVKLFSNLWPHKDCPLYHTENCGYHPRRERFSFVIYQIAVCHFQMLFDVLSTAKYSSEARICCWRRKFSTIYCNFSKNKVGDCQYFFSPTFNFSIIMENLRSNLTFLKNFAIPFF